MPIRKKTGEKCIPKGGGGSAYILLPPPCGCLFISTIPKGGGGSAGILSPTLRVSMYKYHSKRGAGIPPPPYGCLFISTVPTGEGRYSPLPPAGAHV